MPIKKPECIKKDRDENALPAKRLGCLHIAVEEDLDFQEIVVRFGILFWYLRLHLHTVMLGLFLN